MIESTRLFSVVSWGCAATHWLAKVLNSHPEILCLHQGNWAFQEDNPEVTNQGYLEALLNMAKGYAAVGDVHGLPRHEINAARQKYGDHFQAVVLVREPLSRIRSQLAHFETMRGRGRDVLYNLDYIYPVAEAKGLSDLRGDSYRTMFVHGANMLNAIQEEVSVGTIHKCEDVTTDHQALARLIDEISGLTVPLTEEWLIQATSMDRIMRHQSGEDPFWGEWEIEALSKIVDPESWDLYVSLGYPKPAFIG